MARDRGGPSGDAGQFEWVNSWASAFDKTPAAAAEPAAPVAERPAQRRQEAVPPRPADVVAQPEPVPAALPARVARFVATRAPAPAHVQSVDGPGGQADQLTRDIAEIERARDALAALPAAPAKRMQTFVLVPSRSHDSVPLLIGGMLALMMLMVFGAAAAMTKIGR